MEEASLKAPVEEEEDGVHMVVLAVKLRFLAPGEGPGGLWTVGWGAECWAYVEAH